MDQIREKNNEITRDEDAYYIEKMKAEVPGLTVTEPDYESFAAVGRAVHEELVASVSGEELYDAIQGLSKEGSFPARVPFGRQMGPLQKTEGCPLR